MDTVDGLKAFVATAQTGSFTAAAEQMGISNRLTSKYVAELENRLGVRLLQRTTRRVGLTPAGAGLLARAPALLDEFDDLLAEVSEDSRGFTGTIRVAAPVTFGEVYAAGMLGRFARAHPGLTLDLRLSDSFVDLAADGIDLAFRIGTPQVQSLKSLRLAMIPAITAAAPSYLDQHGTPATPADLADHACIIDTNWSGGTTRRFTKGDVETDVAISGRLRVNSAQAACALAVAGHGIVWGPKFAMAQAIERGELVQVLGDYDGGTMPLSVVYLEGRVLPRKLRALIDFAQGDARRSGLG